MSGGKLFGIIMGAMATAVVGLLFVDALIVKLREPRGVVCMEAVLARGCGSREMLVCLTPAERAAALERHRAIDQKEQAARIREAQASREAQVAYEKSQERRRAEESASVARASAYLQKVQRQMRCMDENAGRSDAGVLCLSLKR